MPGPVGGPAEFEMPAAFEHPVEDGFRQVGIMEDASPSAERFVRGEEHRPAMQVAVVHDREEHVGRVGTVAEIADLVDHEDVGMGVGRQDVAELTSPRGAGELLDEGRRGGEARLEAVLDGAVGDGDGQMRLAGPARPAEDQAVARRDELGAQEAAEERQPHRRLEGEVVLVDRLEEGEVRAPHAALDARLGAMGNLLGHPEGEDVAVAEALALAALRKLGEQTPHGGQVEAAQEGVEVDRRPGRRHRAPSASAGRRTRWVATYSAPMA